MKSIPQKSYQVISIGKLAQQYLQGQEKGTLFSVTSKGAFILLDHQKMVFLSYGDHCGPLTLNLICNDHGLKHLTHGEDARIIEKNLVFPESNISVSFNDSLVWTPKKIPASLTSIDSFTSNLQKILFQLPITDQTSNLLHFVTAELGFSHAYENIRPDPIIIEKISDIKNNLHTRQINFLAMSLESLLGWGFGLTPSGDDFVLGILLTISRWKEVFHTKGTFENLNQAIIKAAYQKTTTISANLIESAALGFADERITRALDFLVGIKSDPKKIIQGLTGWGHSSGFDSFSGMMMAVSCLSQQN